MNRRGFPTDGKADPRMGKVAGAFGFPTRTRLDCSEPRGKAVLKTPHSRRWRAIRSGRFDLLFADGLVAVKR